MKNKFGYALFTLAAAALLLVPSIGMAVKGESQAGANEILSSKPVLRSADGTWNRDYLTDLVSWLDDRYFLRQEMITAWDEGSALLDTSASEDVILGTNGWLYYGDDLGDITGSGAMTEREIFCCARNLALIQEYAEENGAAFTFAVAPNKSSLYKDNLPDFETVSSLSNRERLTALAQEEGVNCTDLYGVISSQDEVLYFATDSHWTSKGAALGADCLNASLGKESSLYAQGWTPSATHEGDLYAMLYPTGGFLDTDYVPENGFTFSYAKPFTSSEAMTIDTLSENSDGSLLMFRDSFGNLLYPFMAESWGSAFFSRSPAYKLNLMAERGADAVCIELVERNLCRLIQYCPVMPSPERDLPKAEEENVTLAAAAAAGDMDGYLKIAGTLTETPDTDSPVLVRIGGTCYEAFLLQDNGYAIYVPDTCDLNTDCSIIFIYNGKAVSQDLEITRS